jgi:hypothetical protein
MHSAASFIFKSALVQVRHGGHGTEDQRHWAGA